MKKTFFLVIIVLSIFLFGFTKEEATQILKKNKIEISEKGFLDAEKFNNAIDGYEYLAELGFKGSAIDGFGHGTFLNQFVAKIDYNSTDPKLKSRYIKLVKKLVENGADLNPKDIDQSPLITVFWSRNLGMAEYFLKKGANPNIESEDRSLSPFIIAYEYKDIDLIKLLVKYNLDKTKKVKIGDKEEKTIKDLIFELDDKSLNELAFTKSERFLNKVSNSSKIFYTILMLILVIAGFLYGGIIGGIVVFLIMMFFEKYLRPFTSFLFLLLIFFTVKDIIIGLIKGRNEREKEEINENGIYVYLE